MLLEVANWLPCFLLLVLFLIIDGISFKLLADLLKLFINQEQVNGTLCLLRVSFKLFIFFQLFKDFLCGFDTRQAIGMLLSASSNSKVCFRKSLFYPKDAS